MKIKKGLLIILLTIAIVMSSMTFVHADSLTVGVKTDSTKYKRGDTVTVTVSLSNIDSSNGIYGLSGELSYDTDIFEPIVSDANGNSASVTPAPNSGWTTATFNSTTNDFSVFTTTPAKNSLAVLVITLKVKSDARLDDTTIMLQKLTASNMEEDIVTSTAAVRVTIAEETIIPIVEPSPSIAPSPSPKASTNPTAVATKTPSTTNGKLPQTGLDDYIVPIVVGAVMISVGSFIAFMRYKDIK